MPLKTQHEFWFVSRDEFLALPERNCPCFQELRRENKLICREILLQEVITGVLRESVVAVSHRWYTRQHFDPKGKKIRRIKRFLERNVSVSLVWLDWLCLPQRVRFRRDSQEEIYFRSTLAVMLPNLFLGVTVVVLRDRLYTSRFWPNVEMWMAMQVPTKEGIAPASDAEYRVVFECVFEDGAESQARELMDKLWRQKSVEEAVQVLRGDDISVTYTSDKETNLCVLSHIEPDLKAFFDDPNDRKIMVLRQTDADSMIFKNAANQPKEVFNGTAVTILVDRGEFLETETQEAKGIVRKSSLHPLPDDERQRRDDVRKALMFRPKNRLATHALERPNQDMPEFDDAAVPGMLGRSLSGLSEPAMPRRFNSDWSELSESMPQRQTSLHEIPADNTSPIQTAPLPQDIWALHVNTEDMRDIIKSSKLISNNGSATLLKLASLKLLQPSSGSLTILIVDKNVKSRIGPTDVDDGRLQRCFMKEANNVVKQPERFAALVTAMIASSGKVAWEKRHLDTLARDLGYSSLSDAAHIAELQDRRKENCVVLSMGGTVISAGAKLATFTLPGQTVNLFTPNNSVASPECHHALSFVQYFFNPHYNMLCAGLVQSENGDRFVFLPRSTSLETFFVPSQGIPTSYAEETHDSGGTTTGSLASADGCAATSSTDSCTFTKSFSSLSIPVGMTWGLPARYVQKDVLGKGGFGMVCSAYDTRCRRMVAIKKISGVFHDLIHAKRILREISLLARVDHTGVVKMHDIFLSSSSHEDIYLVMEMVETDLKVFLEYELCLKPIHINSLLFNILDGVRYLHSGQVYHRDLKPANILVGHDFTTKICDFGLARATYEGGARRGSCLQRSVSGDISKHVVTFVYRAPELLMCEQIYTESVDIWSVGCIYAELLQMLPGTEYENRRPLFKRLASRAFVDEDAGGFSFAPIGFSMPSFDAHSFSVDCHPGANIIPDYADELQIDRRQINVILEILGSPTAEDIDVLDVGKRNYLKLLGQKQGKGLQSQLHSASADAISFLSEFLQFNPNKRVSAFKSMENPIFAEVCGQRDLESLMRRDLTPLALSIDQETVLNEDLLRRSIIDEIETFTSKMELEADSTEGGAEESSRPVSLPQPPATEHMQASWLRWPGAWGS